MSGARAARTCAGMVRACLACALVAGCADTGESARPAWAYGSASADPVAAPEATSLPRVAPPYDVRSTAATLAEWPRIVPGVVARAVTSFDRGGGNDDGFGGTYSELYEDDRGEHVISTPPAPASCGRSGSRRP